MKKLLAILLLVGCGTTPCEENYSIYTRGLCVNPSGWAVNTENLTNIIDMAEEYYNQFFPQHKVEIEQIFIENNVSLKYSDYLGGARGVTFPEFTDPDGVYYPTRMFVLGWSCWTRNYVVAHETLHVIAKDHMSIDSDTNGSHMVPNLFIIWADKTEVSREETAEYYMAEEIREMCL